MSASSLSAVDALHSPYLQTSFAPHIIPLSDTPVEDLFEGYGSSSQPPSASTLRNITENIRSQVLNTVKPRGELCERLMRELSSKRKERVERARQREMEERAAEERKKNTAVTPKKRGREDETRPPAVGAHGVARQDGTDGHAGKLPCPSVTRHSIGHRKDGRT
jgi:transcriptional adapter 3